MIEAIDAGIDRVDQIIHIADVHIRNTSRHGEYREVLGRLYDEIDDRATADTLCVLAGDLAHSKTEMSPELVQLMMEMLTELGDRLPTFIIPGNHDCFTGDHEVLTRTGWMPLSDYCLGSCECDVAAYSRETGRLSFEEPAAVVQRAHEGDLVHIEGDGVDMVVTPTHQVVHAFTPAGAEYKGDAQDVVPGSFIPLAATSEDTEDDPAGLLTGVAAALPGARIWDDGDAVMIDLPVRADLGHRLTRGLSADVTYAGSDSDVLRVHGGHEARTAAQLVRGGVASALPSMDRRFTASFCEGYSAAMQTRGRVGDIARGRQSAEAVQAAAAFSGYRAVIAEDGEAPYAVILDAGRTGEVHIVERVSASETDVFCLTVPSSNLLVRGGGGEVFIAGNCNLRNTSRLDALTPVVDAVRASHPVRLFKRSGVWRVGDVALAHLSQFDDPSEFPDPSAIPEHLTSVAMYHGVVDGSRTDAGFRLEHEHVTSSTFNGFDMGLLGDVHRRQFIDDAETVAFSGSLVQQNHGEALGHGFLVWDVPERESEYVELRNDYGFRTVEVRRGRVPVDAEMPARPRLRIRMRDTPAGEQRRAVADIRQLYDAEELRIDRSGGGRAADAEAGAVDVGDVRDGAHRADLICKHAERVLGAEESTLAALREVDEECAARIDGDIEARGAVWSMVRFEWSNMFSYGEDNVIDFTGMRGIAGLFAENASGKSSVLDALSFCLFDRCERVSKSADVMNNQSETFSCRAVFEMDGDCFTVERRGTTKSDGHVRVDVDFRVELDGETISLNGAQRRETNRVIRRYIGEYDDFIATALSVQGGGAVFIERTQSQRKDLLSRFIGIDVFDALRDEAKDEIRDVKAVLSDMDGRDLSEEMADAERRLSEARSDHEDAQAALDGAQAEHERLSERLSELRAELRDVPERDLDPNAIERQAEDARAQIEDADRRAEEAERRLSYARARAERLRSDLDGIDVEAVREAAREFRELRETRASAASETERVEDTLADRRSSVERMTEDGHTDFDPDCEYCVRRNRADADELERLRGDIDELQSELERTRSVARRAEQALEERREAHPIETLAGVEQLRHLAREAESDAQRAEAQAITARADRSDAERALERAESDMEAYRQALGDLAHNRDVQARIDEVRPEVRSAASERRRAQDAAQDAHGRVKVAERDRERVSEDLDRYTELSERAHAYDVYIDATSRDGVPYELIQRTMPDIEREVNDILEQVAQFELSMELDNRDVDTYISYEEGERLPVELGSGMEKFVSGLAIRVALTNISSLPRPDFLAIDEGFGVLDSENLNNLSGLFDYLRTRFSFCIIISHLGGMRGAVDDLIEIAPAADGRSAMRYV